MSRSDAVPHCRNCGFTVTLHIEQKCVYASTSFTPYTCPTCSSAMKFADDPEPLGRDKDKRPVDADNRYCIHCYDLTQGRRR
jgi:hypothetical protein